MAAGTRIGRYVVRDVVRRGATSTVYRAEDPETRRGVALKVLGRGASESEQRAFRRQIEVQARIRHPNILPVYDQGTLDDGRPFFTSELLQEAETLEQIVSLSRAGRLHEDSPFRALASVEGLVDHVLIPVAEGIYVANVENDVLHGDLNPSDVLVDGGQVRPYVTDFGQSTPLTLAAESGRARLATKRPPTPWQPPEESRGEVHLRTDVWGLGALLAFLLTGEAPLERSPDLARAAAAARYRPLPTDAPAPLRAIIQKAMAADPDRRYVNARQLAADLRAWRKGGWVRAVDEFGGTEATRIEARQIVARVGRGLLWVGGGLLLGLLIGSFFEYRGGSGPEPRVTDAAHAVDRLDAELTRLAPLAEGLEPEEAARVWAALEERVDAAAERIEQAAPSDARDAVAARIAFVRSRFAPPPVEVKAPEGLRLSARNVGTGVVTELGSGTQRLPPGRYDVADEVGDALRFPAVIPFTVRDPTQRPVAATLQWVIPDAVRSLDRGRVWIRGGTVATGRLPYAEVGETVDVAPFVLDRQPVRSDAYLAFLQALPAVERRSRLPATGFALDEERGTIRVSEARPEDPVLGVSPADARAYCAWASEESGVRLRLPTAAEWMLAVAHPRAGSSPVTETDHGIRGLDAPPLEIVEGAEGALLKGKPPAEAALYVMRPVEDEARVEGVGFRCVRATP